MLHQGSNTKYLNNMLMIPTQIKPSKIHGFGVFTIHKISKGTMVWKYNEQIDYRLGSIPVELTEFATKYAYTPKGRLYHEFPGDAALFINHSITPNIICPNEEDMIASRDIEAGEEITANYYEFDENPESGGKLISS